MLPSLPFPGATIQWTQRRLKQFLVQSHLKLVCQGLKLDTMILGWLLRCLIPHRGWTLLSRSGKWSRALLTTWSLKPWRVFHMNLPPCPACPLPSPSPQPPTLCLFVSNCQATCQATSLPLLSATFPNNNIQASLWIANCAASEDALEVNIFSPFLSFCWSAEAKVSRLRGEYWSQRNFFYSSL